MSRIHTPQSAANRASYNRILCENHSDPVANQVFVSFVFSPLLWLLPSKTIGAQDSSDILQA